MVIACNTSTAHALDALQAATDRFRCIGVIEPGRGPRSASRGERPIGVIGTAGTIAQRRLRPGNPRRSRRARVVVQQACPLFVPLVEEGWFDHPATALVAEEYLAPLRQDGVRSLVLGCTHYPLLKPLLGRPHGPGGYPGRQRGGDGRVAGSRAARQGPGRAERATPAIDSW